MQRARLEVHLPDGVPFAQGDPHHVADDEQGSRAENGRSLGQGAVLGKFSLARAGDRFDDARFSVDAADAVVADVGNVQVAGVVEGEAVRGSELGRGGRSAVAVETAAAARTGEGRNGFRFGVVAADHLVAHVGPVEVAGFVEPQLVRLEELSFGRGAAVAGETGLAGACHGG
jgi:hypothetical protein